MTEPSDNTIEGAPNQINIAIIEDDPDWADYATETLESLGCKVVKSVGDYEQAIDLINEMENLEIEAVLLDNTLGIRQYGERLATIIRETVPNVVIFGFSSLYQKYSDFSTCKDTFTNAEKAREALLLIKKKE